MDIEQIISLKKLIDDDDTNDFFIFPFMSMVLNLTDKKGFLTEKGTKILFNEIEEDFKIISEDPNKPSQRALLRLAVYFTTIYNLVIFYQGFTYGLESKELSEFASKLQPDLIKYLKQISERSEKIIPIAEYQLKSLLPRLNDKYAEIYNIEKRDCWIKDIFQTTVHIPTHPKDLPEGFDGKNLILMD